MAQAKALVLLVLFPLLSGCGIGKDIEITATANGSGSCDHPSQLPGIVGPPGWGLSGITVRRSTLFDLISQRGEPDSRQSISLTDETEICIYLYRETDSDPLQSAATFYYAEAGRITAIEILAPDLFDQVELPTTLDRAVALYGKPSLVGFNQLYGSNSRTIVWLDAGVEAVVAIGNHSAINRTLAIDPDLVNIGAIRFSSPMTLDGYLASYFSSWYSEMRPESDIVDAYPIDPFDWNE